jgi:hypothetical protein
MMFLCLMSRMASTHMNPTIFFLSSSFIFIFKFFVFVLRAAAAIDLLAIFIHACHHHRFMTSQKAIFIMSPYLSSDGTINFIVRANFFFF